MEVLGLIREMGIISGQKIWGLGNMSYSKCVSSAGLQPLSCSPVRRNIVAADLSAIGSAEAEVTRQLVPVYRSYRLMTSSAMTSSATRAGGGDVLMHCSA